jgi:formylglycine-generating enzyme required for sulfatase activity
MTRGATEPGRYVMERTLKATVPLLTAILLLLWAGAGDANSQISVDLPGGTTLTMVWVPPGTFVMGAPESEPGRDLWEGPQHEVTISRGFYLAKYELTQDQWERVMGTTPWEGYDYVEANPECPAVYLTWEDAQAFVHRLNAAESDSLYRLPTEAEWEYACRAGTQTRWSSGEDEAQLWDYAWYRINAWDLGEEYPHEVGTKLPNPWGLHDMHANVWEWCQDRWSEEYPTVAQTDPAGPALGSARVMRGGNVHNYARLTRSAMRSYGDPGVGSWNLGARLLRMGEAPSAVAPYRWGEVKDAHVGAGRTE